MNRTPGPELTGIEKLRAAVRAFGAVNETFLSHFTPLQLLRLHAAWRACGWDFFPDQWEVRQALAAARRGVVPEFEEDPNRRGFRAVYRRGQKRVTA